MEAIQIKERNASKVKGEKSVFTNMKLVTTMQICKFHTLNPIDKQQLEYSVFSGSKNNKEN